MGGCFQVETPARPMAEDRWGEALGETVTGVKPKCEEHQAKRAPRVPGSEALDGFGSCPSWTQRCRICNRCWSVDRRGSDLNAASGLGIWAGSGSSLSPSSQAGPAGGALMNSSIHTLMVVDQGVAYLRLM